MNSLASCITLGLFVFSMSAGCASAPPLNLSKPVSTPVTVTKSPSVPAIVSPAAKEERTPSALRESTEESSHLWTLASSALERGNKHQATRHLERLIRKESGTQEGEKARIELARSSVEHLAHQRALDLLRAPSATHEFERLSTMARAYEGLENYREAAKIWLEAVKAAEDASSGGQARKGAARNLFLTGDPARAEETLEANEKPSLASMVEKVLHPTLLGRLYAEVGKEDPWYAWLALRQARQLWTKGDGPGAREAVAHASKDTASPHIRREAEELAKRLDSWDRVEPQKVGVLMPLTGKYSRSVSGFKLSMELAFAKNPRIIPVFKDTAADPKQAAKMAEELIFKDKVAMILGPVGSFETQAVVEVTQRYHIPHIHLSSKHETGAESETVLRFRVSPREYGATMARYAVNQLGHKRLGIFCPTNGHGYEAMAGFWDEAISLGAEITAVDFFGSKLKNAQAFSPLLAKLLHAQKPGDVQVRFDALFIPASASQMRTMVPLFKFWGVRLQTDPSVKGTKKRPLVQLLGSSGWHHRWLIDKGEDLLDNSVFASPFHYDPSDPHADDFVVRFQRSAARTPLPVHAEVYDAAGLAVLAMTGLEGSDHRVRARLLETLVGIGEIRGATGSHQISSQGTILRRPWLMTVDLDDIRPRLPLLEEIERRNERGRVIEGP